MKKVIIITHDERSYQRLKALVKGLFPEASVSLASDELDRENNTTDKYMDVEISNDKN